MRNKLKIKNKGFTLVEMLVAISLFVVIALFSIGAILSVFDANRRAQSSKTVVDNLNLSLENMIRTVRFGKSYHCGNSGDLHTHQDCSDNNPNNPPTASNQFLATTFYDNTLVRDVIVTYRWNNSSQSIMRSYDGGSEERITSPETVIEYMRFFVFNTDLSDNKQPYVIAVIEGYSGNKSTTQSKFSIQTLMSQMMLDI